MAPILGAVVVVVAVGVIVLSLPFVLHYWDWVDKKLKARKGKN